MIRRAGQYNSTALRNPGPDADQRLVNILLTRPVTKVLLWNLTDVDRTCQVLNLAVHPLKTKMISIDRGMKTIIAKSITVTMT
jgi:hypothetical protein